MRQISLLIDSHFKYSISKRSTLHSLSFTYSHSATRKDPRDSEQNVVVRIYQSSQQLAPTGSECRSVQREGDLQLVANANTLNIMMKMKWFITDSIYYVGN